MVAAIFLAIVVIVSIYLIQYYKNRRFWQLLDKVPGPPSYEIALEIIRTPRRETLALVEKSVAKYGHLFKICVGPIAIVFVTNPEDAEAVLSSRQNITKGDAYEFLEPWLGTGLLTSTGSKWHKRRKMLTPAFHFSILETFFPVFVENSETLVQKLKTCMALEEFDVFPYISHCTLDIICETAMGLKLNIQSGGGSEYINSVRRMNEIVIHRSLRPWLWIKWLYALTTERKDEATALEVLHSMSLGVIQQRKQLRKEQKSPTVPDAVDEFERKRRKAFLDMLLDMSEESNIIMSDEDVREEVDTFMFEGHDTTSSAVSMTLYMLGTHPDIQDKAAEEVLSVCGPADCPLTMNNISQLKYLECIVKETLRLFPAVPIIGRTLTDDVKLGGYLVPAGTTVQLNFYGLHRHPEQFPNPNTFNPDNFLKENSSKRHPYAYVPFSAGPRNCIGQKFALMEEKVILASLLRKYKITAQQKFKDLSLIPESILRPDNGVSLKISERT